MIKRVIIILALIATVGLPFLLRPKQKALESADVTLVIVTPHNEAIRHEYAAGFKEWYKAQTGKSVAIDWRVLGGTSEIGRFFEGEYISAFENYWTNKLGKPWSTEVQAGFQNGRLPADAPALAKEARAAFMASDVGCGVDLFFGGGTPDFARQADAGRIVDAGILQKHPEWFTDDVIPHFFAGAEYWDQGGRWFGCVLSNFGMIYNNDSLKRLGIDHVPQQWTDAKDPRLLGELALCDPTKSGSVAQAFENVIQQQMQRRLLALKAENPTGEAKAIEKQAVREGWIEGLRLVQLMGANSRYFTDTSQKPPIDVAAGNCAIGLCIDFYGRQQDEAVSRRGEPGRLGYAAPPGGSVSSVDPIALMRGAKNREVAQAFIEYVLSEDGQKLWNFKPGTPGGPKQYALRRMPVRKDFYAHTEWEKFCSDPGASPFNAKDQLTYRPEWTNRIFSEMSFVIAIMCQDTHTELVDAWKAIIAAPEPRKSQALAALQDLSIVDYEQTNGTIHKALTAKNKVERITLASELAQAFRKNYERAEKIAKDGME